MLDIVGQMTNKTFVLPYVLCHILGVWFDDTDTVDVVLDIE